MNNLALIETLTKEFEGKEFELISVPKNGTILPAVKIIMQDNICPIVYYDENESVQDVVDEIRGFLRAPEVNAKIDIDFDFEYLKKNLFITIQKKTPDNCVKKECFNLEAVLRVPVKINLPGFMASIKVSRTLLGINKMTEEEAWENAMHNTRGNLIINSLANIMGIPEERDPLGLTVISTKNCIGGASALMFPDIFRNYCKSKNIDSCQIIPSSVHEVILIPDGIDMSTEAIRQMIAQVNDDVVREEERLEAVVYEYDMQDNSIKIVV